MKVKLMGFDERGKVRLSMKVVDQETGKEKVEESRDRRVNSPPDASRRPRPVRGLYVGFVVLEWPNRARQSRSAVVRDTARWLVVLESGLQAQQAARCAQTPLQGGLMWPKGDWSTTCAITRFRDELNSRRAMDAVDFMFGKPDLPEQSVHRFQRHTTSTSPGSHGKLRRAARTGCTGAGAGPHLCLPGADRRGSANDPTALTKVAIRLPAEAVIDLYQSLNQVRKLRSRGGRGGIRARERALDLRGEAVDERRHRVGRRPVGVGAAEVVVARFREPSGGAGGGGRSPSRRRGPSADPPGFGGQPHPGEGEDRVAAVLAPAFEQVGQAFGQRAAQVGRRDRVEDLGRRPPDERAPVGAGLGDQEREVRVGLRRVDDPALEVGPQPLAELQRPPGRPAPGTDVGEGDDGRLERADDPAREVPRRSANPWPARAGRVPEGGRGRGSGGRGRSSGATLLRSPSRRGRRRSGRRRVPARDGERRVELGVFGEAGVTAPRGRSSRRRSRP